MPTEQFSEMSPEKKPQDGNDTRRDEIKVDTRCGLGACKPSCLQKLATIQGFVAFNALANLFTFGIRMYLVSQVTTIEKRFGFSSAQSGLILSASQITFVVCILFFSYYSRHSHIPRILSVTSMIAGATGIMFFTAHFIPFNSERRSSTVAGSMNVSGNASQSMTSSGICDLTDGPPIMEESTCEEGSTSASGSSVAMGIFLAAMLIQGAVTSPRTPLGGTYVDDNNPIPTNSGKYIGIMMGLLTLAPALSFGFGAMSSRLYHTLEETSLTPRDPQWIGAWWLGFLILGSLSMVFSFLLFFFPKRMRSAPVQSIKEKEPGSKKVGNKKSTAKEILKKLLGPLSSVIRTLRIPVVTLLILSSTMHTFALLGMASFFPKYLENQFYIPTYKASIMLAIISLFGSTIGPVVGGFVTSHFRLTTRGNLRVMLGVCVLLTIGCPIGMFLAGQQTNLVKSDFSGQGSQMPVPNNQSCVSGCRCTSDAMRPVCGADGVTYYSPCHAGCFSGGPRSFSNCSCSGGSAVSGYCQPEDPQVYPILVYSTLTSFTVTFATSPSFMILVRSVAKDDKSLALGLSSFVSTLLGHFPAPVVYGAIVDSACYMWQETCSGRGACALYNLSDFRYKIYGTNMGLFFVSVIFMLIALFVHKPSAYETDSMSVSAPKSPNGEPVLKAVTMSEEEKKY